MTKISWNDVGQRFYEAGTDRGVLYLSGMSGVPWNGLIGVNENVSGGDAKPFYFEGYKYLNLASAEEYNATISAYSSPIEFNACDGSASIHQGLFATQQPRKPFGFTYRTLVGNDVDGLNLGYKIHIIYNALAAPAQRSYNTNGDSPSPVTLDWGITTLPPRMTGLKPTAHFVIDSRLTPPRLMQKIEDILYGNDDDDARLPTSTELSNIFTGVPPIAAMNLTFNGSFEDAGSNVTVRRNYIRYPTTSITGYTSLGDVTRTSENGKIKLVNNSVQTRIGVYTPLASPKPAGTYVMSLNAKAVDPSITRVRVQLYDTVAGVTRVSEYRPLVANGISDYRYEFTFTITDVFDRVYMEFSPNGGGSMASGAVSYISDPILEAAIIHRPHFNGDVRPQERRNAANQPQPSASLGWHSTSSATYSRSFDPAGGRRNGTGAATFTRQPTGLNAILAATHGVGMQGWSDTSAVFIPVTPGDVWTISGYATSTKSFKTKMVAWFRDSAGASIVERPEGNFTQNISAGNWARASATVTVPAGAVYMGVQQLVYTANDVPVKGGELTKFCDALIEKGSTLGGFFDGSTGNPAGLGRAWEGAEGLSPSYLYDLDLSVTWTGDVGASESDLVGTGVAIYPSPSGSVRAIQSIRYKDGGIKSLRQIPVNTTRGSAYTDLATSTTPRGLVNGNTYTIVATFYLEYPQNPPIDDIYQRSIVFGGMPDIEYRVNTKALDKTGKQILRLTFTIPPAGAWVLRLYNGGMMGDPSTWWDNIAIVSGEYTGNAFNGDTPNTNTHIYEWVGTPRQSESIMKTWYY